MIQSLTPLTTLGLLAVSVSLFAAPPGGGGGTTPPPPPPPKYSITYLGTLGGTWSMSYGMNNRGDVVGLAERAGGSSGPFVYTTATGMRDLNRLIPNTGLDVPRELVWGPDATSDGVVDLYVTSANSDSVLAYNGATGELLGEFVPAGSGGLDSPHGLDFGPDGNLYVVSRTTDEVLIYSGSTGAFIGVFIAAGNSSLDDPTSIRFGPDQTGDGVPELYVASRQTNEVLTYDGTDGSFLSALFPASPMLVAPAGLEIGVDGALYIGGVSSNNVIRYDFITGDVSQFVIATSGNLKGPRSLVFGADGDLYVTSGDGQSRVLRYDGISGIFVGEVVSDRSGGLSGPVDVTFSDPDHLLVTSSGSHQILVFERPSPDNGPWTFLGSFVPGTGWQLIDAMDINDSGQIVGYGYPRGAFGEFVSAAYRYTPPQGDERFGTVENLGVPGPTSARATSINNNGDVAGHFTSDVDGVWHPFLWRPETGYVDLGTLAGQRTLALAVSNRNSSGNVQVAGLADTSVGRRAWRFDTATGVKQDIGTLAAVSKKRTSRPESEAFDMNNPGQVTGWSTVSSSIEHAFVFTPGSGMVDLGTLGGPDSEGYGINDVRDVVGMAQRSDGVRVAFAHTKLTGMFALEPQITNLDRSKLFNGAIAPWRINNAGQICGPGRPFFNFTGIHGQAYVITPQP